MTSFSRATFLLGFGILLVMAACGSAPRGPAAGTNRADHRIVTVPFDGTASGRLAGDAGGPEAQEDELGTSPWNEYEAAVREHSTHAGRSVRRFAHARALLQAADDERERIANAKRKTQLPRRALWQGPGHFELTPSKRRAWTLTAGGLAVLDVESGRTVDFVLAATGALGVPRSEQLVVWTPSSVIVYDAATTKRRATLAARSPMPVLSDDGRAVAYGTDDGGTAVFDLESLRERHRFTTELAEPSFASGSRFLTHTTDPCSGTDALHVLDATSGRELASIPSACGAPAAIAVHPDGSMLAAARTAISERGLISGTVEVFDAATGQRIDRASGLGWMQNVTFSPDGKLLVVGGLGGLTIWSLPARRGAAIGAQLTNRVASAPIPPSKPSRSNPDDDLQNVASIAFFGPNILATMASTEGALFDRSGRALWRGAVVRAFEVDGALRIATGETTVSFDTRGRRVGEARTQDESARDNEERAFVTRLSGPEFCWYASAPFPASACP